MKIINKDKIIKVYLNNIKNINFKDTDELETYFKDLFFKLKRFLNKTFTGLYDIDIYLDQSYGAIIELKKEDIDYIDYYENEIDMRIIVHEDKFLYKIKDIFEVDKNIIKNMYFYKNNFYLELINSISDATKAKLMEMVEISYKTEDILRYGKKIGQTTQTML